MLDVRDPASLLLAGEVVEAERCYRRLLAEGSQDWRHRYGLGLALLAQGRYAEGVPLYELRETHIMRRPTVPWPKWRGEPVAGKRLAIFPEQGLGDQIAFARFAPVLQRQGADVTLLCAPQLARLFAGLGVRVIPAAGAVEFPDPDFVVHANALLRLAPSVDAVPSEAYLTGSPTTRAGGVGVMTRGNPLQHNDHNRSLPDDLARLLLGRPDAVDLHPDATGASDMQSTADIIASLDLVVSVCTSVAHLAGAMGKPVWIMVPAHDTHWMWMQGRSDTPWYPSARLYRQPRSGDWRPVIDRVTADLELGQKRQDAAIAAGAVGRG